MARFFLPTLATPHFFLLASLLASCKGTESDTVDAFKALARFPYAIALYDIDRDGDLDCLQAMRTDFVQEPLSATYILSIKTEGNNMQNYTYYLRPGPTPDTNVVVIDGDNDHPLKNHFLYSDYEECTLLEFPMHDREVCVLWVASPVKEAVPQTCVDQFEDKCHGGMPTYDKDSCAELIQ